MNFNYLPKELELMILTKLGEFSCFINSLTQKKKNIH